MNDQLLIEQAYRKIYENKSVLISRRNREERKKNYQIVLQKKVQEYIKNGSVGDLDLSNTPITSLPEGLTIGVNLCLINAPITNLPERLTVRGALDLTNTPITSLPEGLTVGGALYLKNTPITSLPEGLKIGGHLDLRNTPITSLPEELKVGGNLYLDNTPISKKYTKDKLKQMLPNVRGEIYK